MLKYLNAFAAGFITMAAIMDLELGRTGYGLVCVGLAVFNVFCCWGQAQKAA